jgi:uncharacterized protein YhaN
MRFEELAYAEGGLPATVRFDARLTIVQLPEEERAGWVARLLGVLEGTRAGDGASVTYVDREGRRIWFDRDDQGGATLIDVATGDEVPYSAAFLSLDGRFDWFASNGLTSAAASDLVVIEADAFKAKEKYDPQELEANLRAARAALARLEKQHRSALTRAQRRDDLRHRIAEIDGRLQEAEAVRAAAVAAAVPDDLDALAKTCRVIAERRDDLVEHLDAATAAGKHELAADARRELIVEVEPAFVDALAALAGACRPFDVTIGAARIEGAGIHATGIETLTTGVLAEVAARIAETMPVAEGTRAALAERAKLAQALQRAERNLPDLAELTAQRAALEQEIADLDASLRAGCPLVSAQEAEMILLRRAGEAGRADRRREALPLVINDSVAPYGPSDKRRLLDALARLEDRTQIVYLTDDPDTLAWASRRDEEAALEGAAS